MSSIESFENFIAEYYVSAAPGSIVVPGEWYKDNVNSVNYVSKKQQLPQVVDTMFETDKVFVHLNELAMDPGFKDLLDSDEKNPKSVVEYIQNWLILKSSSQS